MTLVKILLILAGIVALVWIGKILFAKQKNNSDTPVYPVKNLYDFTMKNIDGKDVPLIDFKGKIVVLVNVASKCGLTPQYEAIESFYKTYQSKGVIVLGFPANNFMGQEPGSNEEIKQFCSTKYNVTFPIFSKISVKGDDQAPLYSWLTKKSENGNSDAEVSWNFQKFVVGKNGEWLGTFSPRTSVKDKSFIEFIDKALN